MRSRFIQYLNEIRTCNRIATNLTALLGLVKRTEQFHLQNLLGRCSSGSNTAAEKYKIMLQGHERDLWLRPGTGDWFIFHEIFTNECYRIPESILPHARTIVDLGANIGLTTLFLSQFFPDARYVCVEPNPFNTAVLRKNVAWLGDRVSVVEVAITDYCGDVAFTDSDWSWGGHIDESDTGSRRVPCSTVANIFQSQEIEFADLVKVDVEGAEDMIFSGWPEWLAKVSCIAIEFHGRYSFGQFEKELQPFGFIAMPEGSSAGNVMNMAVSGHVRSENVRLTSDTWHRASGENR